MYEFRYDYIKTKHQNNVKLCYANAYGFIIHIKTEDVYENITNDVKKRLDTSSYKVDGPLPIGKKKVIT